LASLQKEGYPVEYIREPGGTAIGEAVRNILLDRSNDRMSYEAEALLYAASRAELIEKVVLPKLREGKILLLDRYFDSSIAYQGGGRGLGLPWIQEINRFAIEKASPKLTFLLDLDVAAGLKRKESQQEINRMDLQAVEFHERVRQAYL